MDRSWTNENNRFSRIYIEGVDSFLKFAKEHANGPDNLIRCPCCVCLNTRFKTFENVKRDLHLNGFSNSYTKWIYHGDKVDTFDDNDINDDDDNMFDNVTSELNGDIYDLMLELAKREPKYFEKLFEKASTKLYDGCKESLLSFIIKLMHIKVKNRWSNKSFDMLLELLKDILPEGNTLPSSLHGARRVLDEMELGYQEIEVCKNDCALFYQENVNEERCHVCNESRWKFTEGKGKRGKSKGKTPHKILRYFPLRPRLQRLFMFNKTTSNMRWHKDNRKEEEGAMRHPADSRAWKHFDEKFPQFAQDPRNVRLGLAADGFTPWSSLGNSYSMWPIILICYNLPAFMFMKEEFLMMTLLIPGPRSPGKDIDVYLRPLIDELRDLWENDIETYDFVSKETFQLHAALMWTISDFPGYGLLSGWVTMGKLACPCCMNETQSQQLRSKTGFLGHRCFLSKNHLWRKNRTSFNGKEEHRLKPKDLTGNDVLLWLDSLSHTFGKPGKHQSLDHKRKRNVNHNQANWVKKSIFFELPYWSHLLIRHCLDVMHIEKNICDNILGTVLDINKKTKDNEKAREDLRDLGIREELHMKVRGTDNKPVKLVACFTLSSSEKEKFLEFLKSVKFPDGYAANISRCVKDKKLTGLKSHDCHILLQRLIPVGLRGYLKKKVNDVLCELGDFFRELCSKTLRVKDIERLDKNIPLILCKLEKIFPPAFFTVMVHLAVHLPREALIAGPVHHRWMYPIERNLGCLKRSVRNKARPEGSIAEAYIVKESLNFITMYLTGIETRSNQRTRNYDGPHCEEVEDLSIFSMRARPFIRDRNRAKCGPSISDHELEKAHHFVLCNCEEVEQYLNIYKAEISGVTLEEASAFELTDFDLKQFSQWLKKHINDLWSKNVSTITKGLWALANGPLRLDTKCYRGCMVNGVRFHTKDLDEYRSTQNSGLVVEGNYKSSVVEFFGYLSRVVELVYLGLENSKKRIFGSPFSQAPSQSTDSCILEKTPSKNRQKQGRGPASGQKLDQQVKKHGKYKILFLPGETDAMNFNLDLSNGIGIIVRTNAEIKGARGWDDVSEESKAVCYTRLFEWFDIEDWADKRVQEIINAKFKNAFTRWRCTLHKLYDTLLADDIDPRNVCPRPDLTMEKWLEACDFIEDIDFQRRSHVNSENRNKKLFNHTSGKRTMLSHYKEMTEKSEIELFRKTHVSKSRGGEFLNPAAQSKYNEMVELKKKSVEQDKEPLAEPVIVKSVLGHRSGYIKGMGHGVQVLRSRESNVFAGVDLKEKFLELDSAKAEIVHLTKAHTEQGKKIDKMESQMAMMLQILQHIPGIPSDFCRSS